jgi:uncharacterized protein (TIGR02145 family)
MFLGCEVTLPPTVETVSAVSYNDGEYIEAVGKLVSHGSEIADLRGFLIREKNNERSSGIIMLLSDNEQINFTKRFENLKINKTYYIRAFAKSAAGESYGEIIEVTTSSKPLVIATSAQVLSDTEVILNATVEALNSEVEIWFELWKKGDNPDRIDISNNYNETEKSCFATLGNLVPGEVYAYTVKAQNAAGIVTGETKTFRLFYDQVSDYDGNKYRTVKIGDQIWLAENLRTSRFLNGDVIPNVQSDGDWNAMTSPAYCYYNNNQTHGQTYGKIYNHYVGIDQRGLIAGYRIPNIYDYKTLIEYLGGLDAASMQLRSATNDWKDDTKGENSSGFNVLPGGWRGDNDTFSSLGVYAFFQTNSEYFFQGRQYYFPLVLRNDGYILTAYNVYPYCGTYIRLIKE